MNVLFLVPIGYKGVGGFQLLADGYKRVLEEKGWHVFIFEMPYHIKPWKRNNISSAINNQVKLHCIACVISFTLNLSYALAKQLSIDSNVTKIGFLMDCMKLNARSIRKTKRNLIPKIKYALREVLYTYKEKRCLNAFKRCVFVSPVDGDYVRRHYSKSKARIVVIPNGISLPTAYFARKEDAGITIGCLTGFGKETIENDLKRLIFEIFPRILESNPSTELVIAGRGAPDSFVTAIKELPNVRFLGFVENLIDFYSCVDLIVSTVSKECGILNRVLEAWSYGKAVIGYKKNFLAFEKAKENHHFFVAENPQDFAESIRLIREGVLQLPASDDLTNFVKENYSWNVSGNQLIRLIEESLKNE